MSESHQNKLTQKDIIEKRKLNCKLAATREVQIKSVNNTNWIERNKNLRKSISKSIIQYDLEGNFIKEWECASDIQKELENYWAFEISLVCKNKSNFYKRFIWKYKNPEEIKTRSYKNIKQYDLKGNLVKIWDNTGLILKEFKLSRSNLYSCINGKYKTWGGFIWKI